MNTTDNKILTETKKISELNEALAATIPKFTIANPILRMFGRTQDAELEEEEEIIEKAMERFHASSKIYKAVWNNGQPKIKLAFFYKLEDRSEMDYLYHRVLRELEFSYKAWVAKLNRAPKHDEMLQFFKSISEQLLKEGSTASKIKFEMIQYIEKQANLPKLLTRDHKEIKEWFEQVKTSKGLIIMSDARFFRMSTAHFLEIANTGCVYKPDPGLHNWGMNAAWTLAITRCSIPIKIASDITIEVLARRKANPEEEYNPSAFSLEIAIAILMGYGLNIDRNHITLIPASTPFDYRTNGIPGNGPLPTKPMQIEIFQRCVAARELHRYLSLGLIELRAHVSKIFTEANDRDQFNFIYGLLYLYRGKSLIPILEGLHRKQLSQLHKLLETATYNDPALDSLKIEIYHYYLTAFLATTSQKNRKTVHDFVMQLCNSPDIRVKNSLIESLTMLNKKDKLIAVLQVVSFDSLHYLNKFLSRPEFKADHYIALQKQIQIETSKKYQAWLQNILQKQNHFGPKLFIEKLNTLIDDGQLEQILGFFPEELLVKLKEILKQPEFSNSQFNQLNLKVQSLHQASTKTSTEPTLTPKPGKR